MRYGPTASTLTAGRIKSRASRPKTRPSRRRRNVLWLILRGYRHEDIQHTGDACAGGRGHKAHKSRRRSILTEKYVRAEVKIPDAETPFRLERLADEIIAGMVRGDAKIVCWFFG
jgi:hypothetical protein